MCVCKSRKTVEGNMRTFLATNLALNTATCLPLRVSESSI